MALYAGTSANNISIIAPGTNSDRPASPSSGTLRFNTTTNSLDGYSTSWNNISQVPLVTYGLLLHLDAARAGSYPGYGSIISDLTNNITTTVGTSNVSPTFNSANLGYFDYNGTSSSFGFSPTITLVTGNGARSVFIWMKKSGWPGTTYYCLFSSGNPNTAQAFNLVTYVNPRIGIMGYDYDYYPSTGSVTANIFDGNWHYVGVTYDGTTLKTYVDGIQDNSTSRGSYNTTGTANYIGQSNHIAGNNQAWWPGSLGSLHYYNRALTDSEIGINFNGLRARYGR